MLYEVITIDTTRPRLEFGSGGDRYRLEARFVAGCDGYHGPSRHAIPANKCREYEQVYPFGS